MIRIKAVAAERIEKGDRVVIRDGKIEKDRGVLPVRPLKKSYLGWGLFDRDGRFWSADINKKNLESFSHDLTDQNDPDGPFRILRINITPQEDAL